ncbi:hypothetical protein IQ07DRAFT_584781 [Pyrenochaeta sp. DS3sAY3a]|nr:hypothetical protein IQ07DRAFT_584781 [Pyrenochaeta sp. DS3sAY3a]
MVALDDIRKQQKRLTWTPFHLPSTQPWPIWSDITVPENNESLDPHLGYLCNVQGVENVRIARRVENVEQAAFIILWTFSDALISFQTSPLFETFLKDLDSSGNLSAKAASASPTPLISLQMEYGFDMNNKLHGRITLCKYTGIGTWDAWHMGWRNALVGFTPLGCDSIARKRPPMLNWCITWVDKEGGEQQGRLGIPNEKRTRMLAAVSRGEQQKETGAGEGGAESEGKLRIATGDERVRERWEFLRWNAPHYGATREREEKSFKRRGAWQHWEEAFKRYVPPVQTWELERWDISTPHQSPNVEHEDEFEFEDFQDLKFEEDEDDSMNDIEEDDSMPAIGGMKLS